MQSSALKALGQWTTHDGASCAVVVENVLPLVCIALESQKTGRQLILTWIDTIVRKVTEKLDLHVLISCAVDCLQDPVSGVREAALTLLGPIVQSVGENNVRNACRVSHLNIVERYSFLNLYFLGCKTSNNATNSTTIRDSVY